MNQSTLYNLFKSVILCTGIIIGLAACEDDSTPELPSEPAVTPLYEVDSLVAFYPEKVVITMHDGHSHLYPNSANPEPGKGIIFYGKTGITGGGFHANPYDPNSKYPFKRVQSMTFERQENGSYKHTEGDDIFRVQASPTFNGSYKALIIQMYDKDSNRIDLDYKTPEMRDRTQLFFLPKNPQAIIRSKVEGIAVSDTAYLLENETSSSKDKFRKVLEAYDYDPSQPLPLSYEIRQPYTAGLNPNQIFSYYYCDRATDDPTRSPTLATPVGFRGVFENRTSYVAYDLDIIVTVLPEGETKGSNFATADNPTAKQLKHVAFVIRVPFRNVTERYNSNFIELAQPAKGWFDKELGIYSFEYESDILSELGLNKILHQDIMREYPQYPMKELIEMYKDILNADPEASQFWL